MNRFSGLVFFFLTLKVIGQPPVPPLPAATTTTDSLFTLYQASLGANLPLYNGRQFYGDAPSIKEHAYYPVNEWSNGSVLYDNMWYKNVQIMYDVHKDQVVIMHPNGIPFILFSGRVQEFSFKGLVFIHFFSAKDKSMPSGIYQRVATGKLTVFAKRAKMLEEKIIGLELERKFVVKDIFYVLKDNSYTKIKKQHSLLAMVEDKHTEVRQYLKQARIKYKMGAEAYITQVAAFYNKFYQ